MASFQFEPIYQMSKETLIDLEEANSNFVKFFNDNFKRFYDFLREEEKLGNYVELDLPQLETNFSYKLNLFFGKLMITVLDHKDSKIFGHLLIDGYDCLDSKGIKKLGDYHVHKDKFKRLNF